MSHDMENLSRSLMDVIYKVRDKESLVELTQALLRAKAAALIQLEASLTEKSEGQLVAVYPQNFSKAVLTQKPDRLWKWLSKTAQSEIVAEGTLMDSALFTGNESFKGGLVAFGRRDIDDRNHQYALLALQDSDEKMNYLSNHVWVAHNLLRHYLFRLSEQERNELKQERNELKRERNELKQEKNELKAQSYTYSTGIGYRVLPDETWTGLKDRIQAFRPRPKMVCRGIWICFQIFKHINEKDITKSRFDLWIECEIPINKTDEQNIKELLCVIRILLGWDESLSPFKDGDNSQCACTRFLIETFDEEKSPAADSLAGQLVFLFLSYAWWRILKQAFKKEKKSCCKEDPPNEKSKKDHPKDPIVILLNKVIATPVSGMLDLSAEVNRLMTVTRKTLAAFMRSDYFECPDTGLRKWDREALRLYLAIEITTAGSKLSQLYLDGERRSEHRCAPEHLRRHFCINLARFMISVMGTCLNRLNQKLSPDLRLITPSEELDSLLYMVDRYAHVELRVDPQLNIREMLNRQIAAEVRQHLSSPHYRDHLLHVIDVFMLGHLILNTQIHWIDKIEMPLVDHLCRIHDERKPNEINLTLKESWLRNWAVASLLHDIGYQIGDGTHITREDKIWEDYFSLNTDDSPKWLQYEGPNDNTAFLRTLFQEISQVTELCRQMFPDSDKKLPSKENLIVDHGMLSALRISQVLLHSDNHDAPTPTSSPNFNGIKRYYHAIHAIALHNLHSHKVRLQDHPLAVLLRLCDELQEWDRRRVNVERLIKGLYLDIQENRHEDLTGHDLLNAFCANIAIGSDRPCDKKSLPLVLISDKEKEARFYFQLYYKDAVSAQFDPIMTLLGKSYCFQDLDLSVDLQKQNDIRIMVEMLFPVPKDYQGMLEYDIYGMFTEEQRDLSLLQQAEDIASSEAGLIKLKPKEIPDQPPERFGLVLQRNSEDRMNRIPTNPGSYRDRYTEFKKRLLPHP